MKKITTTKSHFEQINLALAYINSNFSISITADELAKISGYSIFHFHRIFKDITGENVNDYIRNTRLEKASNLLLYNQHHTIERIAQDCGFATGTGFSASFKKRFLVTPKEWRKGGYDKYIKDDEKFNILDIDDDYEIPIPTITNEEILPILYLRVYGYENDMSRVWNRLYAWCEETDILTSEHRFVGLFHNHPSFLPYEKARYLACVQTSKEIYRNGEIGKCRIRGGKFAKFEFACNHEDLYKLMHLAYTKWLPNSDYELRNFPAYVEYKDTKSLLLNDTLNVDFYMPIQLII